MPLIQSKSKQALQKNIKTEMDAHPDKNNRAQNLAIGYAIQKRNQRKKMAAGGEVISAANEGRPGTDQEFADAMDARQNAHEAGYRKPEDWTSTEDEPHTESGANRQGPSNMDRATQHNNGRSAYAQGGRVKDTGMDLMEHNDEDDLLDSVMPNGNRAEQPKGMYNESEASITSGDPDETHPHTGETQEDMMRRHAMEMEHFVKGGPVGPMNPKLHESKMEPDEGDSLVQEIMHSRKHKQMMAEGGDVLDANDRKHIASKNFAGPDRSYPIEDETHARNALARVSQHGSPELKEKVREKVHSKYPGIEQKNMAHGGKIRSDQGIGNSESMFDFPQGEVDLEGNTKEDLNNEDQMSYRAGNAEQYDLRQLSKQPRGSNAKGDSREMDSENKNDESDVAQIRRKMKKKAA